MQVMDELLSRYGAAIGVQQAQHLFHCHCTISARVQVSQGVTQFLIVLL